METCLGGGSTALVLSPFFLRAGCLVDDGLKELWTVGPVDLQVSAVAGVG